MPLCLLFWFVVVVWLRVVLVLIPVVCCFSGGYVLVLLWWFSCGFGVMLAELFSTGCLGFVIVVLVAGWLSS